MPMNNHKGFTLVELMVVVSIIAVLAAIAIPIYRNYVYRGKQVEAKSILMSIKVEQEQFFAENNCYTTNPADLTQSNILVTNANVYKTVIASGDNTAPCNAAGRAKDFKFSVTGNLASTRPLDRWGISDRISGPVHCDGRSGYTADQTAACGGGSTTEMEF